MKQTLLKKHFISVKIMIIMIQSPQSIKQQYNTLNIHGFVIYLSTVIIASVNSEFH